MPLDLGRELERVKDLRSRCFDAVLILTSFSQSPYPPAYAAYLAGIPVRIGSSKEFGGSVLSHWQKSPPDEIHQVDRNLALLEYAGIPPAGTHLEMNVPGDVRYRAENLLRSSGVDPLDPYILIAPGASCAARRYDPQRFAAVADLLQQQTHLPIVLVGSDREQELVEPFRKENVGVVSLVGRTSIPELAWVIRRSALVLANDSAPMHIADVFRRPLVVLYSGTELESQWRPRNTRSRLLRRQTECSPCYRFRCPYAMECLDIPAEEVAAEAVSLLNETVQRERA
jgi:ADP-heptose:LPS heptosyltransferase